MIPNRPNFGTGPGGGSATEERLQDAWDAKYAPDLETARRTIDVLLTERMGERDRIAACVLAENEACAEIAEQNSGPTLGIKIRARRQAMDR